MPVIKFPKKALRVRRTTVSPTKKVGEAVAELIDHSGADEAFHVVAEIAEKIRRELRKRQKMRKS